MNRLRPRRVVAGKSRDVRQLRLVSPSRKSRLGEKMNILAKMWDFVVSPSIYCAYADHYYQSLYHRNLLEKMGDQVIKSIYIMSNLGLYTSPLIVSYLHKRKYMLQESLMLFGRTVVGFGAILCFAYFVRGLGRAANPAYIRFYQVLSAAKRTLNQDTKKALNRYDFEFREWPVEFSWSDAEVNDERFSAGRRTASIPRESALMSVSNRILSFLMAHTFGIKMVYPGSIQTLQYFMSPVILQGRAKLVVEQGGQRSKLRTRDGNDIDTMFVDKRGKHPNGEILVICCEGNSGFYEMGIVMTPVKANFSVLGWNHPGFAGSTGTPFPSQEQNAVDCVMQFAIHYLGFYPDNIMLYGWSIGGYTASWVAMHYPDIRGLILDATFDDILPLALMHMPKSWAPLVQRTIRTYINLNVYESLLNYNGPVTFIRRTEDEIICTEEGNLASNRGNHLVAQILKYRYPLLFDERGELLLNEWLASDGLQQSLMWTRYRVDQNQCKGILTSYVEENGLDFPMLIGDDFPDDLKNNIIVFLADAHLKSFNSTHCTPLPDSMFRIPWSPIP